jgi:DNA-binding GntR family transcriptional regulator
MEEANAELHGLESDHPPPPGRFFDLDGRFHQACVDVGAGARLRKLHEAVKPQTERYVRIYVSTLGGMVGTSVEEHTVVIAAIRSGAPNRAQEAMQENWRNAAHRLARIIDSVGEQGAW